MNIFILSRDPVEAAKWQCDKHIVKMCSESAQMLCSVHEPGVAPWKRSHYNHPCTVWTRTSVDNYRWHILHALALCEEYTQRYGRRHAAQDVIEWCKNNEPELPSAGLTPFPRAIKDPTYHDQDIVTSYRAYYIGDKSRFARWRYSSPPPWWPIELNNQ